MRSMWKGYSDDRVERLARGLRSTARGASDGVLSAMVTGNAEYARRAGFSLLLTRHTCDELLAALPDDALKEARRGYEWFFFDPGNTDEEARS